MEFTPIDEIEKQVEELEKQIAEEENRSLSIPVKESELQVTVVGKGGEDIIGDQRKENLKAISQSSEFLRKSLEVDSRTVNAELDKQANITLDTEIQNEYKQYELKKLKEKLDYKTKLEKTISKQEVKAEVAQKKYDIALKRYGYLYKPTVKQIMDENGNPLLDENGNPITTIVPSKDFTPNKFINRTKELANYYANLSDTAKKVIWTTVKFVLFASAGSLVVWGLVAIFKRLATSGVLG